MASSSSRTRLWKYDVFLSFRGPDTRKNIVSHIYSALRNKGIFTFKDDRTLEVGNSIPDELVRAIQTSRFAVVVISENYAASTWCLEELRMIMELQAVEGGISVVPIFFRVAPCDVRHQSGSFGTAFASRVSHEKAEKVTLWRTVLTKVANLSGFDSSVCVDEATMVEDVVRHLLDGLFPAHTTDDEDVVGMSRHMEGLASLLEMESEEEVRFVGISGMGGVGKTTIAKYLYRRFSRQFPVRCFIDGIAKVYKEKGLPYLRKKFLSQIFRDEHVSLGSVGAGSDEIKSRLGHQKLFAVLDDVDQVEQLLGLAKFPTWFGPGSRIIIITRDKGLLDACRVKNVYPVKCLDQEDALQMFKHISFGGGPCPDGFEKLLIRASRLAHGLPYALHSYSLHLHRKTAEEWEKVLLEFEKAPHTNIFHFLRSSYEGLTPRDKIAFLHVACLFNGHHVLRASSLLFDGGRKVRHLVEKSLVDISAQGCINMHVLVEEMGRELVLEESDHIPERQRILWGNKVYDVLLDNIGTERIEGLALDMCEMPDVLHIEDSSFRAMRKLKFLIFYTHLDDKRSKLELLQHAARLPRMLRLLHWDDYPLTILPLSSAVLVELTLRRSNLRTLWNNDMLRNLKRLDVSGSKDLTQLPDLSMAMELEELVAEGCMKLRLIRLTSTRRRYSLRHLDISNCVALPNLPPFIPEWISVADEPIFFRCQGTRLKFEITALGPFENLCIDGDIKIRLQQLVGDAEYLSYISKQQTTFELRLMRPSNWPESHISGKTLHIKRSYYNNNGGAPFSCMSFSGFSCLAELKLINLNIDKLPDDIDLLHSLEKLDLTGNDFTHLPTTLGSLEKLNFLILCNCSKLEELPSLPRQLQRLELSGCTNLQSLPAAHQESSQLLELHLDDCKNVQSLAHSLDKFTNLMLLNLSGHDFQTIPTSITNLLKLGTLCLNNCNKLKSLEELPLSLNYLNAHGCNSLETVLLPLNHCMEHLDLSHCAQLNQCEEVITQFLRGWKHEEELLRFACIPGILIPRYFVNQFPGGSIQLSFNSVGFTACIIVACSRPYHLQFSESSYCWSWEAGGVFRINLRPNIYRSYGMEEEEAITEHYLVIIHVLCSKNKDQVANLLFNSALQLPEMSEIPLVEIRACGVRIDIPNQN
uniref:TIR domain-containing protein n=3 Tax=Brassica oleracea TaxID=3712 RepID=A0A0D3CX13_BRAOL|nr:unnamed protein product [Brassica oleracea]